MSTNHLITCGQCKTTYNFFERSKESKYFVVTMGPGGHEYHLCSLQCYIEFRYERMISSLVNFDNKSTHGYNRNVNIGSLKRNWCLAYNNMIKPKQFWQWLSEFIIQNDVRFLSFLHKFSITEYDDDFNELVAMKSNGTVWHKRLLHKIIQKPDYWKSYTTDGKPKVTTPSFLNKAIQPEHLNNIKASYHPIQPLDPVRRLSDVPVEVVEALVQVVEMNVKLDQISFDSGKDLNWADA